MKKNVPISRKFFIEFKEECEFNACRVLTDEEVMMLMVRDLLNYAGYISKPLSKFYDKDDFANDLQLYFK
jgi:hypothetical protein